MQTEPLEFAEVRKFRFGAPVTASDGPAGKVHSICVDAHSRQVTCVGVRTGFLAFGKTCYVPMSAIATSSRDELVLTVSLDEMQRTMTTRPAGELLTSSASIVSTTKGHWHLTQVTVNAETHILRHLVGRAMGGQEVLIPAAIITGIGSGKVTVNLGSTKADQLVPFRPDADLRQAVYSAIYNYEPLRIDLPGIEIHAIDGTVWLKGNVSSDLNRRLVEDQLMNIAGLAEIHNELYSDTELSAEIARALARDPRTANEHIGVYPRLGTIRLRGNVRSDSARHAATEIARGIPGAKSISNELHVNPTATVVPTLAGVTNEEDMVPGGG